MYLQRVIKRAPMKYIDFIKNARELVNEQYPPQL